MKTATTDLQNLLATATELWMADLFTFTLSDGSILRYTSADIDVVVGIREFSHYGPTIKRSRTRTVIGVSTDTLDVGLSTDGTHTIAGTPLMQAAMNGVFDGATVELERCFSAGPGQPIAGTVLLFVGRVSDTTADGITIKMQVRSHLELLNIAMPRNLYQPPCGFSLYDSGCGVNRATHGVNSSVASGSTRQVINCALAQAAGHFDIGELVFTGGPNIGVRRTVRSYAPGVVTLAYPLPFQPVVGNNFTIYPGCDKRLTTCETKFNNRARFRATPFVPVPETAL